MIQPVNLKHEEVFFSQPSVSMVFLIEISVVRIAEMLHQKFIDKINELDLDDVDDNQEEYLYDFLGFLQNWLVNHILRVDKLIPAK